VTTSIKKAAVVAPGASATSRAGDQAMVDVLNRISGRLESLETRLADVSSELVADVPSVDDVVASIKNSELGADITWIKKAISKVKQARVRVGCVVRDAAVACVIPCAVVVNVTRYDVVDCVTRAAAGVQGDEDGGGQGRVHRRGVDGWSVAAAAAAAAAAVQDAAAG